MTRPLGSPYDLFVFYADADRAWVEGYLFDALGAAGVSHHTEAAFALGVPRFHEFERAIKQSQHTLLVYSPALLVNDFTQFTDLLAQNYGLETGSWPVIPLILHYPGRRPIQAGPSPRFASRPTSSGPRPEPWLSQSTISFWYTRIPIGLGLKAS